MTLKYDAGPATATGDTTETTIGTITLAQTAKRIIGVWCYATGGAAITTAEPATGIFRLDSADISFAPMKLPLDVVVVLTSGVGAYSPRIFPLDIPAPGGSKIECFVTMDLAQTGALKARFGLVYEV